MATQGDLDRLAAYERVWDRSAEFRRIHRQFAVLLGIVLLVGSLVVIRLRVPALTRIVDVEQATAAEVPTQRHAAADRPDPVPHT